MPLPPELTLQPHQQRVQQAAAAAAASGEPLRTLLYHGLGSGKSISSLAASDALGQPTTVVVPAALRAGYTKERQRFAPDGPPTDVVSYQAAAAGKAPANPTLVVDEAQRIGSAGSAQSRAVRELAAKAKNVVLLSGTPTRNDPGEFAPLLEALTGRRMTPDEFRARYVGTERSYPGGVVGRLLGRDPVERPVLQNVDELKALLAGKVDYYAADKPPVDVQDETVEAELSKPQAQLYRAMWDQLPYLTRWKLRWNYPLTDDEFRRSRAFLTGPRQVALSTLPYQAKADPLRAFQDSGKLQKAYANLRATLDPDPRTRAIVYSNFVDAGLRPYAAGLAAAGVPHAVFHGGLSDADRRQLQDDFNGGKIRVALVGPSGSEGLSLKGAQLQQLLDPYWQPARTAQAAARGLRFDSHAGLPPELQRLKRERYVGVLPPGLKGRLLATVGLTDPADRTTADHYLQAMSDRKQRLTDQLHDVLKQVAQADADSRLSEKRAEAEDDDARCLSRYKCPVCGGTNAFNGVPGTGTTFRGSGVCQDNGCKFSIVGLRLKPIGKGPKIEPTAEQVERWRKSDELMRRLEEKRAAADRPFTVAVDLDGTLAKAEEPFDPKSVGRPIAKTVRWVRKLHAAGARVIVFTVRGDAALVRRWLDEHDVPYDYVNENPDQPPDASGKVIADAYLDDRAHNVADLDSVGPDLLAKTNERVRAKAAAAPFAPDFTPDQLRTMGVYRRLYDEPDTRPASMRHWPAHWFSEHDPKGWLQWYDRYSSGRRLPDEDARQIGRWASFKARHGAQFAVNPTPRRAFALQHWAIDPFAMLPPDQHPPLRLAMAKQAAVDRRTAAVEKLLAEFKDHPEYSAVGVRVNPTADAAWLDVRDWGSSDIGDPLEAGLKKLFKHVERVNEGAPPHGGGWVRVKAADDTWAERHPLFTGRAAGAAAALTSALAAYAAMLANTARTRRAGPAGTSRLLSAARVPADLPVVRSKGLDNAYYSSDASGFMSDDPRKQTAAERHGYVAMDPDLARLPILAHELGHAEYQNAGPVHRFAQGPLRRLSALGSLGVSALAPLAGAVAAGRNEVDPLEAAGVAGLVGGVAAAPILWNEYRASARGTRILRDAGYGPGTLSSARKALAPAWLTYAMPPVVAPAVGAGVAGYLTHKSADDVIALLRRAKQHSDLGTADGYAAKAAILRDLIRRDPTAWAVDSQQPHTVGLTHRTGFRFHLPRRHVVDLLPDAAAPVLSAPAAVG